jgi:hypothetical protein
MSVQRQVGRYGLIAVVAILSGLLVYDLTVSGLYTASDASPRIAEVMGLTDPASIPPQDAPVQPDPGVLALMQNASVMVNSIAATLGIVSQQLYP